MMTFSPGKGVLWRPPGTYSTPYGQKTEATSVGLCCWSINPHLMLSTLS